MNNNIIMKYLDTIVIFHFTLHKDQSGSKYISSSKLLLMNKVLFYAFTFLYNLLVRASLAKLYHITITMRADTGIGHSEGI